jgi:glycopeptide antibiotics resistance protein
MNFLHTTKRQYSLVPLFFMLGANLLLAFGMIFLVKDLGWTKSSALEVGVVGAVIVGLMFYFVRSKFP